jgi:hypothetical protein
VAEERLPSEEELREALDKVGVSDVLVNALTAVVSLGYHRLSPEARDLSQARLAIEALRALEPVLREGGVDEGLVRDLEQARANLQLAYAAAVAETAAGEPSPQPEARKREAEPQHEAGDAEAETGAESSEGPDETGPGTDA